MQRKSCPCGYFCVFEHPTDVHIDADNNHLCLGIIGPGNTAPKPPQRKSKASELAFPMYAKDCFPKSTSLGMEIAVLRATDVVCMSLIRRLSSSNLSVIY